MHIFFQMRVVSLARGVLNLNQVITLNYTLNHLVLVSGDSVPAHLEWEPEQPPLLVLPGAGGRFESQREL